MKKRIDLHIHTNFSDGILSPKEVIEEASKNGVTVIAITDHDTIDAYDEELYRYAQNRNVKLISGVEMSTRTEKGGVHVLGYNFDIHDKAFKQKLSSLRNARHTYLYDVATKLEQLGYIVHVEELDKIEAVTKAHIALDIIKNVENEEVLLKTFGHIPMKGEFIETIMNKGCPAYVKKEMVTPKEAAMLIRDAGGKVVLAHPVAYQYQNGLMQEDLIDIMHEMKPDGIEAYYIYVNRNNDKVNEIEKWCKIAKENHLITTIGSDFHNKDGRRPEIGLLQEPFNIEDETIEDTLAYLLDEKI